MQIIMIIIAVAAAFGIILLAYTKEGIKFRKDGGANDYITGLMMAIIVYFWETDLIAFITGKTDVSALSYLFVFGAPVLLAIWAIYTRKKVKEQLKNAIKEKKRK